MISKEFTAKTIEEALKLALNEFQVSENEVEYNVLVEPSKGFLGIGSKQAVIKVRKKEMQPTCEPVIPQQDVVEPEVAVQDVVAEGDVFDPKEKGLVFLSKMVEEMGMDAQITIKETPEAMIFDISGENLGILIGRRGDTLDSIQVLLNLVVNEKGQDRVKAIVDIENYRAKREETLIQLSHKLANKAIKTGKRVSLEPMNPQERWVIHMTLQDNMKVTTHSEGQEPYRRVVIMPEKKYQKKTYDK